MFTLRHQYDPAHHLRLQSLDRTRHRQVGFARARRADPEGKIVRANIVQVLGLVGAACAHRATRSAHLELIGRLALAGESFMAVHVQLLERYMHTLRIDRLALCARVQVLQHRLGALDGGGQSDDLEAIAAAPHFDAEPRLDLAQMFVKRSA